MKITAVGDCAVQKVIPRFYDGFENVRDYIMQGDVRFFNLETTVCEDCYPARHSGGTWLRTEKEVLFGLKEYGFNATTPANNHCMDYSMDGFLQTLENIKDAGFYLSGGGRNLAEASRPVYIDTPNGRVAIISCTTDYSPGAEAGEQSRDFIGRPGINPLAVTKVVYVGKDDLKKLSEIADKTTLNAEHLSSIKAGYELPDADGEVDFDGTKFRLGENGINYEISQNDMKRIETMIKDAAFQADIVIISIHTHIMQGDNMENIPSFLKEFAHRCIDLGAHAVIGHGPHLLRPFEIYKGLPIFYSLGDFILHLENCRMLPYEYYEKYGLTPEAGIYELFKTRTRNFTVGLQRQQEMTEAVIPYFEIEKGVLKSLEFMPVELGFGKPHPSFGWPREAKNSTILKRFSDMSNIPIAANGKVL